MSEPTHIRIRNARTHNLKGVDLDVPRHQLVVFTGVSGSGKSSLAHDTIHQEGQRRFMESLSAYARQFVGQMERPPVDLVEGVSPTLAIDQKTVNRNPRSTVGTVTEILDHLRLLWSRLGIPHCPECGKEVKKLALDRIVDKVLGVFDEHRVMVLAPVVRERKGEYRKELEAWQRDGWLRARIDGDIVRLTEPPELARYEKHTIELVVDRLVVRGSERARISEAVASAVRLSEGLATIVAPDVAALEMNFSTQRSCADHPGVAIPELEPRTFSFNAPQGACEACKGLGRLEEFDLDRLIDLEEKPGDAFAAFNADDKLPFANFDRNDLKTVCKLIGIKLSKPLSKQSADGVDRLIFGDPDLTWVQKRTKGKREETRERVWRGLIPMVESVWHYTKHKPFEAFRSTCICPQCGGARLSAVSRAVTFHGVAMPSVVSLSIGELAAWFEALELEGTEREIGAQLLSEIRSRLSFLVEVGLGYLTLDRSATTLSGGEAQRIRLAAQVGSALHGVTYVLDEPSIGLHPRDNQRLLAAMRRLRDRGNTVLVVEHDAETILAADWVVDVGPGAGKRGGQIMGSAPPAELMASETSPTAQWLRGERSIAMPKKRRKAKGWIGVKGATANNLEGVDARWPLGCFVAVTGVSGSGKSSLTFEAMEKSVRSVLKGGKPVNCTSVSGADKVDKIVRISQTPIGRTPRSNPATYTKVWDAIRGLFAATPLSKARGYKKGRFSFNVKGGRCESCQGAGVIVVEMQFLPNVEVVCELCNGMRFNRETLEVTWKGLNIANVLALTIEDAVGVFGAIPRVNRVLQTLLDVGLDYMTLGQPSTTLSGGEAQRVKLASELQRPATGSTLYLLDEPTTGLHFEDVQKLINALQSLVEQGNTVVVVEHHTDLVRCADYVIDMGPEGGSGGGKLVGSGTPEQLAKLDTPTGRVLAEANKVGKGEALPIPERGEAVSRPDALVVKGARQHNLSGVDVSVPHGKMTVVTGVSGSGKTSLAFDTIFSEGQRQYVESLSTYARRFLGRMDRAQVDSVEGLQPAIAIDQRSSGHNPRSTVATVTELHDVLRLLWARIGQAHCPTCDKPVRGYSPTEVATALREAEPGAGWLTAPLLPDENPKVRADGLIAEGWARVLSSKLEQLELASDEGVRALLAGCRLVIDRVNPATTEHSRIGEAVESAYRMGVACEFVPRREGKILRFTPEAQCSEHGAVFEGELTPRHFSFNNRLGACTKCDGVGMRTGAVLERVMPFPELPLKAALSTSAWGILNRSDRNLALLDAILKVHGIRPSMPVSSWSKAAFREVFHGRSEPLEIKWSQTWGSTKRTIEEAREWVGILGRVELGGRPAQKLLDEVDCGACEGHRLRPAVLAVRVEGVSIAEFTALPVEDARATAHSWQLEGASATIAQRPLDELRQRLGFLADVGLGYLGLDRAANTLSGGESQRIRLASQLGSKLCGVTYVLDEPTIGLHPRDTKRLLGTLEGLRDQGNTVLLVEHDAETMWRADHIIDMGPGAGVHGGRLMSSGTPSFVAADPNSITGRWLSGDAKLQLPGERREPVGWMEIKAPTQNNLRAKKVRIPQGVWVGVSGVSGSGKSSLILKVLAESIKEGKAMGCKSYKASAPMERLVVVDQRPIGRSPRSTPATYTKVLDHLRRLYANIPGAVERGLTPASFSYNSPKGGRCGECEGRGSILVEMHFLPDVWVVCDVCNGRRFGSLVLDVRWQGLTIADVLALPALEALELFRHHRNLKKPLQAMVDVGLGYLTLGQPVHTLSGGEAQRLKLAHELTSRAKASLYLLDEPTSGLHMNDVQKLVAVLHALVDRGHTVITIEHHVDLLAQCDWLVELGPEGGSQGGLVVAEGPPPKVARKKTPTGLALAAR